MPKAPSTTHSSSFVTIAQSEAFGTSNSPDIRAIRRKFSVYVFSFPNPMLHAQPPRQSPPELGPPKSWEFPRDLNLKGTNFPNAASTFFIAGLVAAVPNSDSRKPLLSKSRSHAYCAIVYLIQRLPTAHYLSLSLDACGLCTACHASLQNYAGLLTAQILSGAFEFCRVFSSSPPQ